MASSPQGKASSATAGQAMRSLSASRLVVWVTLVQRGGFSSNAGDQSDGGGTAEGIAVDPVDGGRPPQRRRARPHPARARGAASVAPAGTPADHAWLAKPRTSALPGDRRRRPGHGATLRSTGHKRPGRPRPPGRSEPDASCGNTRKAAGKGGGAGAVGPHEAWVRSGVASLTIASCEGDDD